MKAIKLFILFAVIHKQIITLILREHFSYKETKHSHSSKVKPKNVQKLIEICKHLIPAKTFDISWFAEMGIAKWLNSAT